MMLRIFILSVVLALSSAEFVNIVDCDDTTTHSKNVKMEVSDCGSADERCPLYQGKNHSVVFHLTPTKTFNGPVDFRVFGVFPKFSVPYGRRSDACEQSTYVGDGSKCNKNVKADQFTSDREVRHDSKFAVSMSYPKVKLNVRFVLQERRSKVMLMCKELPVEIKDPQNL